MCCCQTQNTIFPEIVKQLCFLFSLVNKISVYEIFKSSDSVFIYSVPTFCGTLLVEFSKQNILKTLKTLGIGHYVVVMKRPTITNVSWCIRSRSSVCLSETALWSLAAFILTGRKVIFLESHSSHSHSVILICHFFPETKFHKSTINHQLQAGNMNSDLIQYVWWPHCPLIPAAVQIGIHAVDVFVSHHPKRDKEPGWEGGGRTREQRAGDAESKGGGGRSVWVIRPAWLRWWSSRCYFWRHH